MSPRTLQADEYAIVHRGPLGVLGPTLKASLHTQRMAEAQMGEGEGKTILTLLLYFFLSSWITFLVSMEAIPPRPL